MKYTAQNMELQNKVQLLEEQNLSLIHQLRKLQAMVIEISNKTSSSSTCILVLLVSFCLLLVPAMYSSDTRGACQLSMECCPASFVPSPVRTLTSWSCLPCSQRCQKTTHTSGWTAQTTYSRLLATLPAYCTTCLRLPVQSLPWSGHSLTSSQSLSAEVPSSPAGKSHKEGGWLPTGSPSVILQNRYSG